MYTQPGCYYWRPLEVYTPNSPPEILYSDPAQGAVMQIRTSQKIQLIVAQDTDPGDTLSFSGLSLGQSFWVLVKRLFNKSSSVQDRHPTGGRKLAWKNINLCRS